jgi:dephospho-CoA kinase
LAAEQKEVHSALTDLFAPGGDLNQTPPEVRAYFDDLAIVRTAKVYMSRQTDVTAGGHAVVVAAGPPGAGKTEALSTMALKGYRVIDPDVAKDLLLNEAERLGLLAYRNAYVLPDDRPVGVRELAAHIHTISTRTTDIVRQLALAAGENVIIDGTLSWAPLADQYISELFSAGYDDLEVVDVEAPLTVALERARDRWWTGRQTDLALGGRFVPDQVIESFYVDHLWQSSCAANALILAERAADELGRGKLRRFDVDTTTGAVRQSSETVF